MDSERLARYLAGEATAPERAEVEAWAAATEANAAELARLEAGWTRTPPSRNWDVDAAWLKVRSRLDQPAAAPIRLRRRWVAPWLAAAAMIILGVGLGRWWSTRPRPAIYATAVGQQRTLHLADGSVVMLAPDSRLTVDPGYGRSSRQVELQGHAWFAVRHDAGKPFRVTTGFTVIEDLGTEFVVETHGGEVQVAVMSGSVSVRSSKLPGKPAITLGPRDVAVVAPDQAPAISHQIAVERIAGWRDGTLAFDGRPARAVLAELERWYPVTFVLTDSTLADRHLFVTLPTTDLPEAVGIVAGALGAVASQEGTVVTLTPRGAR